MFSHEDMTREMERALESRKDDKRFREMAQFLEDKRRSGIAQKQQYTLPRVSMSSVPFGQARAQRR